MTNTTVAVLGASSNPTRYAYQAVTLLAERGYRVFPVHPSATPIAGLPCYPTLSAIPEPPDTITVYLAEKHSTPLIAEILACHPRRVIVNPGAENAALTSRCRAAGLQVLAACTLLLVRTGQFYNTGACSPRHHRTAVACSAVLSPRMPAGIRPGHQRVRHGDRRPGDDGDVLRRAVLLGVRAHAPGHDGGCPRRTQPAGDDAVVMRRRGQAGGAGNLPGRHIDIHQGKLRAVAEVQAQLPVPDGNGKPPGRRRIDGQCRRPGHSYSPPCPAPARAAWRRR